MPGRTVASLERDLTCFSMPRVGPHVNLEPARCVRCVGEPATVWREVGPTLGVPGGNQGIRRSPVPLERYEHDVAFVLDNPTFLDAVDGFSSMPIVARLRQGTPEAQALAAANVALQRFMQEPALAWARGEAFSHARLVPAGRGEYGLRRQYVTPLLVLMAMAALAWLIASANAANLLLARASARAKEVALRLCAGAGRRRLIRQFLTESVLLALAGGAVGLACAYWGTASIVALFNVWQQPLVHDVPVNTRILGFAGLISLEAGFAFGLMPALKGADIDLTALKGGQDPRRDVIPGGSPDARD